MLKAKEQAEKTIAGLEKNLGTLLLPGARKVLLDKLAEIFQRINEWCKDYESQKDQNIDFIIQKMKNDAYEIFQDLISRKEK